MSSSFFSTSSGMWVYQRRMQVVRPIHAPCSCTSLHGIWCRYPVDLFQHDFVTYTLTESPSLTVKSNVNLTNIQKELLLWHWKTGISMSHLQELMVLHQAQDINSLQDMMTCAMCYFAHFQNCGDFSYPKVHYMHIGTGSLLSVGVNQTACCWGEGRHSISQLLSTQWLCLHG